MLRVDGTESTLFACYTKHADDSVTEQPNIIPSGAQEDGSCKLRELRGVVQSNLGHSRTGT
jgi:hypothetical protein